MASCRPPPASPARVAVLASAAKMDHVKTGGTLLINNGATVQFTNAVYNDIHGANGTGVTVSGSGTTLLPYFCSLSA